MYRLARRSLFVAAGLLILAIFSTAAEAATTTLTFGGSVSTVDSALTGTFTPGDPVSIKLVYDPAAADLIAPNPNQAAYPYISFDLTFGSYRASFGAQFPNSVVVLNNTNQGLGPADAFGASAFQTGAGAPVGGLPLQQGFVSLFDFTQTAFDGTNLPAAPSFAAFSNRVGGLTFCSNSGCGVGSNFSTVLADIGSMSAVTTVPEPATVALLLAGIAVVCWRKQRRVDSAGASNHPELTRDFQSPAQRAESRLHRWFKSRARLQAYKFSISGSRCAAEDSAGRADQAALR